MTMKTEYGFFNEDDFVYDGGEMKELTVTITICEYRNIIAERVGAKMKLIACRSN